MSWSTFAATNVLYQVCVNDEEDQDDENNDDEAQVAEQKQHATDIENSEQGNNGV